MKVGIVGCGGIAAAHAKAYQDNGATIVALADVSLAAAEKMAEGLQGAKAFDNYERMFEAIKLDVVSVCSPPVAHEAAVLSALGRGINVLCEKPLAHSLASAKRMAAAAATSKALLVPAFRHRYLPAVNKLRELLREGAIGKPIFFNNAFCGPAFGMETRWFTKKAVAGGGCLIDTASHSIDLFRHILGDIVESHIVMSRHFESTDVEDTAVLTLKSADSALGSLMCSFVAGQGAAYIEVTGTEGKLAYDYCVPTELNLYKKGEKQTLAVAASNGFAEQTAAFLAAIEGKGKTLATVEDGVKAMEVIARSYHEA